MYKHIKKEHVFIFLVILTALVLFTYFEDFKYTSLTTKQLCTDEGYQCCNKGQGEGVNYFSLDYSCPANKQCWSSCTENIKETNLITTSAVLDNIWNPIKNFFVKLFSKEVVGEIRTDCSVNDRLLSVSEGHANKFIEGDNAYNKYICSSNFKKDETTGTIIIYLSSDTNAHVEENKNMEGSSLTIQNYPVLIKVKTKDDQNPTCNYKQECEDIIEECLFSISGDTNAHIGDCEIRNGVVYNTKICCELGRSPPRRVGPGEGFTLDITIEPNGAGSITKDPNKNRYNNEMVEITANSNPSYEFSYFTYGDIQRGINPLSILMNQDRNVRAVFNLIGGTPQIPPLTQSDYEVYWANDGIVAFNFKKYIDRLNEAQRTQINKFEIYKKDISFTSIQELNPIITLPYRIANGRLELMQEEGGYAPYFDFWDGGNKRTRYSSSPLNAGTYYYAIVPVKRDNTKNTNVNSIQVTVTNTNTLLTVSGSCNTIPYGQCIPNNQPQYCGYRDNLLQNNGFESIQLWSNKYLTESNSRFNIETEATTNSKVAKLEIPSQSPRTQYLGIYQTVNVKPNNYYNLSVFIKASNIDNSKKPYLYVDCYNSSLSYYPTLGRFLEKSFNKITIENSENFKEYSLMFKTYKGAQKCDIYPIFFDDNGGTGTISIDKIRLEELGDIIPQNNVITTNIHNNDCGICGCPANTPYCLANGECSLTNLCGNGVLDSGEACDYNSQNPNNPIFPQGKNCDTETNHIKPNGNLRCTQQCIIDPTQCTTQPLQPETCDRTTPLVDADNDGIKALFDSDCSDTFNNYISIEEAIPSQSEAYTLTDINIECKYNILDIEGNEKTGINRLTKSEERLLKEYINAYISSEENVCKQKSINTGTNIVLFKKCNVGEEVGDDIPVVCEVSDKCSIYEGEGIISELISVNEYEYCSEINEDYIEISNINLNRANEPGEELIIKGNVLTDEEGIITIKSALINLEEDRILKEVSEDIEYDSQNPERFELSFEIPSITKGNYFIFIKAYIKNQEADTCSQTFTTREIISDLDDEGFEFCNDLIDNDNDGLEDCEDDDCSTDPSCIEPIDCIEGSRCDTGLLGICSIGTQTCLEDGSFSECISIQPGQRQEVPNNRQDDDCDGETDEGAGLVGADSDDDGLPDSWEMQYFRNLNQGPNNDYDGDGITNIKEFENRTDPTEEELAEEKPNLLWLWVILGIILLGIIIFIVFKFLSKPKLGGGASSYADPRLKSYVQDSLRRGFTKNQIKQALLTKGWSQGDIDKVLR